MEARAEYPVEIEVGKSRKMSGFVLYALYGRRYLFDKKKEEKIVEKGGIFFKKERKLKKSGEN